MIFKRIKLVFMEILVALLYDDSRYEEEPSIKNSRIFKYFKYLLGFSPLTDEDFIPFECAGALWGGYPDGSVNPHPVCITCHSQLSFIDKDTIICDKCHKTKAQIGEFHFSHNNSEIQFQEAYDLAHEVWKERLVELTNEKTTKPTSR